MTGPVIVSGFGPWGVIDENPTALVVEGLAQARRPGLVTLTLPVESAAVSALVERALDAHRPALWIGLGLAPGAAVVAVERIAVNIRDFAEPDIAGARPRDGCVVEDGPAAYRATWPAAVVVRQLRAGGIPARASTSAGTFLCNQLLYLVLHGAAQRALPMRAGFLHVPAHPALVARQGGKAGEQPSMEIATLARAVLLAIDAVQASTAIA